MNPPGSSPPLGQHNHHHHPMPGFTNEGFAAMGFRPRMMFQTPANNQMAAMGMPGADPGLIAAAMSSMLLPGAMTPNIPGYGSAQQIAEKAPTAEPANPASFWKEHRTTEGRVFWHNVKTNKSTWDKPDELRTDVERILATSTNWREYPSGEGNDKSYWHHLETKQSEWEKPEEVGLILSRMAEIDAENWSDRKFDGKSQAKAEFKSYLERKGIGHKGRWEDVGKVLQTDSKWKIFDSMLTTGERKHIFNEYVNQLQKKTREEQRIKKAAVRLRRYDLSFQARDTLGEFLVKWRAGEIPFSKPMAADVTYLDFEDIAGDHSWFHLLEPIDIAEGLEESAQQVADEMFNRPSKARQDELAKLFADSPEHILPLNAPIEQVIDLVNKCSESSSPPLHPVSILSAWQRHVRGWAWNRRHKAKRKLYREERKVRDSFRLLLHEAEEQGLLDAKSEWTTFLKGPRPVKRFKTTEEGEVLSRSTSSSAANESTSKINIEETLAVGEMEPFSSSNTLQETESRQTPPSDRGPDHKDSGSDHKDAAEVFAKPAEAFESRQEAWEIVYKVCGRFVGDSGRICDDLRYVSMFVQGGSSPRELFEDFVYGLWDVYEAARSQVKNSVTASSGLGQTLLASIVMMSQEEFSELLLAETKIDVLKPDLWKLANRPGVLAPLQASLTKRLRRAAAAEEQPDQH